MLKLAVFGLAIGFSQVSGSDALELTTYNDSPLMLHSIGTSAHAFYRTFLGKFKLCIRNEWRHRRDQDVFHESIGHIPSAKRFAAAAAKARAAKVRTWSAVYLGQDRIVRIRHEDGKILEDRKRWKPRVVMGSPYDILWFHAPFDQPVDIMIRVRQKPTRTLCSAIWTDLQSATQGTIPITLHIRRDSWFTHGNLAVWPFADDPLPTPEYLRQNLTVYCDGKRAQESALDP
jgi:hypothetical protein